MFSCYAYEKKNKKQNIKESKNEEDKNINDINEDMNNCNMEQLKKMDEEALKKLKLKLNMAYNTLVYENTLNKEKLAVNKLVIDEYNKNLEDEDENKDNILKNYMNNISPILDSEITKMKNKNEELNKEYLSLFDTLLSLNDPYSRLTRLKDKIYLLENSLQEQENKLKYLNEKSNFYSNASSNEYIVKDIFLELFRPKNHESNLNLIEEKSSESSSSSSSSSTGKAKEPFNTLGNNPGDAKESTKLKKHNTIPKEVVEDSKRMLGVIFKNNYETVTKHYQKVISSAQNELQNKNTNTKKLEILKNEIKNMKDNSRKIKMLDEEEKVNNEKKVLEKKEKEKKMEMKNNKRQYYEKSEEFEELKKKLDELNEELRREEEEYKLNEKRLKENNESLKEKIEEGNQIQIELEEVLKERDSLLENISGNKNDDDNNVNDEENEESKDE